VIDGVLRKGDRVTAYSSGENYEILDVRPFQTHVPDAFMSVTVNSVFCSVVYIVG